MTPTQKLHKLLSAALSHEDFQLDAKAVSHEYVEIAHLLISLGWFTKDHVQAYQCSQCGGMHEIEVFRGKYYIGCDTDDRSGLEELDKNKLLIYRFSLALFVVWINQQLGLAESPEKVSEQTWYLGEMTTPGKRHPVYFSQDVADVPRAKDRVALMIGNDKHETQHDVVNLLAHLSATDQSTSLNREVLKAQFAEHQPVVGLVVSIGEQIQLTQSKDRSTNLLHFDSQNNGEYRHVLPITPQTYNIIYHLDHLRNSTNSHKSSAEMKQDGLGTSARSITTRITDFNKLFTNQGWEKLVLRDSNYRYYINPDYYT